MPPAFPRRSTQELWLADHGIDLLKPFAYGIVLGADLEGEIAEQAADHSADACQCIRLHLSDQHEKAAQTSNDRSRIGEDVHLLVPLPHPVLVDDCEGQRLLGGDEVIPSARQRPH